MGKGRKTESVDLAKLKGTYQTSRHKDRGSTLPVIVKLKPAPKWFSTQAKKLYKSSAAVLIQYGLLTDVNYHLFLAYVNEISIYLELSEAVKLQGYYIEVYESIYNEEKGTDENGNKFHNKEFKEKVLAGIKKNPNISIAKESLTAAIKLASEFGLTPASMSKIKFGDTEEDDGFDNFLNV